MKIYYCFYLYPHLVSQQVDPTMIRKKRKFRFSSLHPEILNLFPSFFSDAAPRVGLVLTNYWFLKNSRGSWLLCSLRSLQYKIVGISYLNIQLFNCGSVSIGLGQPVRTSLFSSLKMFSLESNVRH